MPSSVRNRGWASSWRNMRIGAEALRAHRLRSAMTTLGVLFGVGAVICMLAIGKGAEQRVLAELRQMGVHNLYVEESTEEKSVAKSRGLVAEDAEAAAVELAVHVRGAAPERSADRTVHVGERSADVRLAGVTPEYATFRDLDLVEGRFVSDLDEQERAAVCVLSVPLAETLLPASRPLGAVVRCGAQALRVVGVVGGLALSAQARPLLFVPLSMAWCMLPQGRDAREVQRIVVHLDPRADQAALGSVLEAALRRRHGGVHDFRVVVPSELIRKEQRTQHIFQIVMGSIAGISLLVGGIGIANTMFASVVERTAEIGIRRAVGARRRDILAQFLFESSAIGAVGGSIGIVLGVLGATVVGRSAHWPTLITPASILVSTATAITTGLVSGAVPARRAAMVDAIVALHHE
jgi:putative ABC transport system permease protein